MAEGAITKTGRFTHDHPVDGRLRLVLDTMQDAFVEIDGDGTITDWNRAAEALFGWKRTQVLGRTLADTIVPRRLRGAHTDAIARFIDGGDPRVTGRRLELPALNRAGREFPVEVSIAPLRIDDEWRFAAFLRDVTPRVAERRSAERRHGRLEETERFARVGSWDWVAGSGDVIWSEELCRIHGEDPRTWRPTVERTLERIHPSDRRRVRATATAAARGGDTQAPSAAGTSDFESEYRIVRPDGEVRTLNVRGTVLRDRLGQVVRAMGTAQDVTDRVQAEARNRRLAALVQSTEDAVVSHDLETRITSWNESAQRLFGYEEHEVLGRPIGVLLPARRAGEERLLLGRVLGGERIVGYETQRVARDGRLVDVELTVSAVRDETGHIVEASVIARDITARKRGERELEHYVEELEALALRDPLTGLLARRELRGLLERETARAEREGVECSLLLVDVDGLAAVNHRDGHEAGDALLRELAAVVRRTAPDVAPCRLTDDEIALVLPGVPAGAAMALARRLNEAWDAEPRAATISTGVATWPAEVEDKGRLFERAAAALAFDKPAATGAQHTLPEPLLAGGDADPVEHVLGLLRRHLGMEIAYVSEFTPDEQIVRRTDSAEEAPAIAVGDSFELCDTYCRRMVEGELANVIPDTSQNPVTRELDVTSVAKIGAYIGVPVRMSDGTLYGSLCCASRTARPDLGEEAGHFARVCARLVADLVEQRELETQNRRLHAELTGVRALLAALDARDHYTGAHSEAVVALAVAVGRRLALSSEELGAVEQVALLHDIGKIGVPDSILQKPGPLDAEEWERMRQHPAIGARIVESITSLAHLAPAIRAEHERWDGGGYPDGLKEDAIPLASRIILAADALHAMTSDRPYRKAMSLEEAREELVAGGGTQFDPRVVAALLAELTPAEPTPDGAGAEQAPASEDEPSGRPSVLVVEDNASFRLALDAGLESEGFEVEAVGDAAAAYQRVREMKPDIVLLDWILPGGDGGAAACRRIRQLCPRAEVVIFTGLGDVRDRRAALEAGASTFLQKGMPLPALVEHLQAVLTAAR